jgi:hypothetical protein
MDYSGLPDTSFPQPACESIQSTCHLLFLTTRKPTGEERLRLDLSREIDRINSVRNNQRRVRVLDGIERFWFLFHHSNGGRVW